MTKQVETSQKRTAFQRIVNAALELGSFDLERLAEQAGTKPATTALVIESILRSQTNTLSVHPVDTLASDHQIMYEVADARELYSLLHDYRFDHSEFLKNSSSLSLVSESNEIVRCFSDAIKNEKPTATERRTWLKHAESLLSSNLELLKGADLPAKIGAETYLLWEAIQKLSDDTLSKLQVREGKDLPVSPAATINRIRLNGFRSFVEPTEIVIRKGLTGIVGPNGCGKSNILSAIEWVVGNNVSVSRSSNALDAVVFSGSSSRPPGSFAEVMIEVESAENLPLPFPSGQKSFQIVRRATRDTGSAYKVNGEDIRASVVRNFFSDVSIDLHSPALVRQGKISELINASPRNRNRILLEAAGVSGFSRKKHEAELKLKGAEANLPRVSDLIEQLSTQLKALDRQARVSERYRLINEEIRLSQHWLLENRLRDAEGVRAQLNEITERVLWQLGDQQKSIVSIENTDDQNGGDGETATPMEELGATISQIEEWSLKASAVLESAESTLRTALLQAGSRSDADISEKQKTSDPNSTEDRESYGNPEYFEHIRDKSVRELEQTIVQLGIERNALGAVNLRAKEDAKEVQKELDQLSAEKEDLERAIQTLRQGITSLEIDSRERLLDSFKHVNFNFNLLFCHLFGGGEASLVMVESDDPLEAGLEIMCRVPGKKLSTLSLLSGGEQSLIALALIFAVLLANPTPLCVLDEVDAALDGPNVERFCELLDEMAQRVDTKFLVITHHSATMARMDRLYGVTMLERGVSQLVSLELAVAKELVA